VEVFRRWHDILSAGSGTSFLAAMPNVGTPAVLPPCLDIWFDARKEDGQVVVGAFCHGIAVRLELPEIFSIPHAEAYAVPIGLLMLESSLPNLNLVSVQLHSDALATALNLASGAPKTPIMLQAHAETVRCSPMQRLRGRVFITQCYGTANPAGDSASRSGQDETGLQHIQRLQRLCEALGVRLCWVDTVPQAVKSMIDKAVAILQKHAAPTLLTAADDAFAVGLASAKQSGWVVAPSPCAHAMGWSGLQARTPPEEPWSPSPVRQPSCSKQLFGPGPGASPISPQHVTVQSPASPIAVSAAISRQTPVKRGAHRGFCLGPLLQRPCADT